MKYIDADKLKAELDKRYAEYRAKMKTDDFTYYEGMADALDLFEQYIDSLPEQPVEGLEEEITTWIPAHISGGDDEVWKDTKKAVTEWAGIVARHFAEWGARHSINWGDVQLLDTFILELSREEKDGTDWGDSEKFYTEVLRRFHEFNDKKIPEIVAEWGAEHARKEE